MGRVSRAAQRRHKEEILEIAARQVKSRGIDGVTIPGVMATAGLTPGGFYGHFSSKADLSAQAVARAFELQTERFDRVDRRFNADHEGAVRAVLEFYFSDLHRTDLDESCPMAALSGDVARQPEGSAARAAYVKGLESNLTQFASLGSGVEASREQRAKALSTMATAVGAIVMARAASGDPIADEIIDAARAGLA